MDMNAALKPIEAAINNALAPIAQAANDIVFYQATIGGVGVPVVVMWLAIASLFFTFYFGFINVRGFGHAFRLVRGDFAKKEDKGEVSQAWALSAALAGTLGVGNVAGVALAITMGGPGAVFWMTITGLFGMSLKFAECALAVKHRSIGADGIVNGGPMHYLPVAFAKIGLAPVGKLLAAFFSFATMLAATSLIQVNQAFAQVKHVTGLESPLIFGLLFALAVGLVIVGGMKSIARLSSKLVPSLVFVYFIAAAVVLIVKASNLPGVFEAIFAGAFTPGAVGGGIAGAFIIGVQRAVYAAESGLGSAAIAHASAKTDQPLSEGFVALFEPFLSTIVVCNLTALVILASGVPISNTEISGVELASGAFQTVMPWFGPVLALLVALLAYKTTVAWAYYGERSWGWLVGEGPRRRTAYRVGFLAALTIAPILSPVEAIRFLDAMVFAMSVPNIIALYLLAPALKQDLQIYLARLRSGTLTMTPAPSAT